MKQKAFDCVKMKWEIQRRLQERLAGLSPAEAERVALDQILSDLAFAKLWEEARRTVTTPPSTTVSGTSAS